MSFIASSGISGERRLTQTFLPVDLYEDIRRDSRIPSIRVSTVERECSADSSTMMLYCNYQPMRKANVSKPVKKFSTGSKYVGDWDGDGLGFTGKGIYHYPHGVTYDGNFKNGLYDGKGILIYPNGTRVEGVWKKGKLVGEPNLIAKTGEVVSEVQYCRVPDRRFQVEIDSYLNPAGQEYLTNQSPPAREIPEGCYDTGIGFYHPNHKTLIPYDGHMEGSFNVLTQYVIGEKIEEGSDSFIELLKRWGPTELGYIDVPLLATENWVAKHCRRAWDEPQGYKPDLYEYWTYGRSDYECTLSRIPPPVVQIKITDEIPECFHYDTYTDKAVQRKPSEEVTQTLLRTISAMFQPKELETYDQGQSSEEETISAGIVTSSDTTMEMQKLRRLSTMFGVRLGESIESDEADDTIRKVSTMFRVEKVRADEDYDELGVQRQGRSFFNFTRRTSSEEESAEMKASERSDTDRSVQISSSYEEGSRSRMTPMKSILKMPSKRKSSDVVKINSQQSVNQARLFAPRPIIKVNKSVATLHRDSDNTNVTLSATGSQTSL